MFFNDRQQKLLSYPLDGSRVKTIEKAGRKFSYLPTFDVVNTLNLIFGFDGWETRIKKLEMLDSSMNQNGNHIVTFSAIVQLKVWDNTHKHFIIREDSGVSISTARTMAEAIETASKASISDGLKRAAKSYGNSLGNALYDPEQRDVDYSNSNQFRNHPSDQVQQQYQQQPPTQQINYTPQDYSSLYNIGLTILEQGQNLVVMGEDQYNKRDSIKACGFKFDATSKTWWKPIQQQAA